METQSRENPIRKIVNLMQNMVKEIEVEGAKEKDLFDKFMCFCENGAADLLKSANDAKAENEAATSKHDADVSEKSTLEQDIKNHQSDLENAEADLNKATQIRDKEKAEYDETVATKSASADALGRAIPAIEKGMGGGASLMQFVGHKGLRQLKRAIMAAQEITPSDRQDVVAFLEGKGPGGGEILGMLKAMADELSRDLATLMKNEETAVAGFSDMKASKEKEIEFADESIESKKERVGNLAVEIVQLKNDIEDSAEEAADATKFAAQLDKQCAAKKKEWAGRCKMRNDEIAAIGEAIAILNDDDALDTFKKSALVQEPSSLETPTHHVHRNMFTGELVFLQTRSTSSPAQRLHKVQEVLSKAATSSNSRVGLMLFTLKSKVRLAQKTRGAVDFSVIFKMIDDMIVVLGKESKDDAAQKDVCVGSLDKTDREKAATEDKLSALEASIAEITDNIATVAEAIKTLEDGVKALDKDVATATEQRKEEHGDYTENVQMTEVAIQIMGKAKNRLLKFYNPSLATGFVQKKAQPVQESVPAVDGKSALAGEEAAFDAPEASEFADASFLQVRARSGVEPPQAPDSPGGAYQKNEKSGGVMALMDTMTNDLKSSLQEAKFTEKSAQEDYVELMQESQEKRAADLKSIVDQEGAKAEMEGALSEAKENQALSMEELENVSQTLAKLHGSCDFILKNFETRLDARNAEIDGLKNAKAVLAGADFR